MNTAQISLAPRAPGFAPQLRLWRKSRKLSQLQLALASDISQRHLSFLELGRSQPSRDMVLRLAAALEVPLRAQNQMLTAAGYAGLYHERALDDQAMAPVMAALRLMLRHHEPNPAVVVDRNWNLLLVNQAMQRLFGLIGNPDDLWARVCGDGPRNLLKMSFHPQGSRAHIVNWAEVAPVMLARTRREAEADCNQELLALLQEVESWCEDRADWAALPEGQDLAPVIPMTLRSGDLQLSLFSMISTFGTPADITTDEIRVESFFAADESTQRLLEALAQTAPSE